MRYCESKKCALLGMVHVDISLAGNWSNENWMYIARELYVTIWPCIFIFINLSSAENVNILHQLV